MSRRPLTAPEIAAEHGFTARHWTRLARQGRIKAWQPNPPRGHYLFKAEEVRGWLIANGRIQPEPNEVVVPHKPPRAETADDRIYFLYSAGHIKIGVSRSSSRRFHSFRTASPVPIALLGTQQGSTLVETEFHKRFHGCRSTGEWFRLSPALRAFLDDAFGPDRLSEAEQQFRAWLAEVSP